jgi:hypothetical protein
MKLGGIYLGMFAAVDPFAWASSIGKERKEKVEQCEHPQFNGAEWT